MDSLEVLFTYHGCQTVVKLISKPDFFTNYSEPQTREKLKVLPNQRSYSIPTFFH